MGILGGSRHPVFVKKIFLKIWLLRDEVEAIIQKRVEHQKDHGTEVSIEDLKTEYTLSEKAVAIADNENENDNVESNNLESGEDEMAAAIAGGDGEDAMAAALAEAGEEADGEEVSEVESTETPEGSSSQKMISQHIPILTDEKIVNGSSFLSEISIDEMYLFSAKEYLVGQSIVLEFLIPRKFVINAIVTYCRVYNIRSRIISPNKLPYRIGVKFSFLKDGERSILREFLKSIEPDIPQEKSPSESEEDGENNEDDDFGDLEDLV